LRRPRPGDVPWSGRDRLAIPRLDASAVTLEVAADTVTVAADALRAVVRLSPFGIDWQQSSNGRWITCCADRSTYAYATGQRTTRVVHSVARDAHDQYFGLGDKTGPLDKHGRRLRTLQLDALGYNGETSDPLYKHWPFFVGRRRDSGLCYGVYYDTLSETTFDFGQEFDNYHGFYRSTDIADGDLDYYVLAGPKRARRAGAFHAPDRRYGAAAALDARLREHRRWVWPMRRMPRRSSRRFWRGRARNGSRCRRFISVRATRAAASGAMSTRGIVTNSPNRSA
jgi:alpha-glucosidase (family GH31 glycosyl hydrolase)